MSSNRLDRSATALAVAILMAYASVSDAQDTREAAPRSSDAPAAEVGPLAPTRPRALSPAIRSVRLSDLVGMGVRNERGESLGQVEDLVVDLDGSRVAYAVVGIGGVLGIGEKLSSFPMSAFRFVPASARAGGGLRLVLNASPERLKSAPNFDRERWPDWNDAKYRSEVDRAAGARSSPAGSRLVRASQLMEARIRDGQNRAIGEIDDLVLDVRGGAVQYAVVDFDEAWRRDDKLVAVPLKALRPAGDPGELSFAGDRSEIERAPAFDKGRWPDLNAGAFRTEVERYVSGWGGAGGSARGSATPGAGMTGAPTDRSSGSTAASPGR